MTKNQTNIVEKEHIETVQAEEAKPKPKGRKLVLEIVETLVLAVVLFFLIDAFLARVRVENVSMEPTLKPGNFLLVNKLAYKWGKMQVGDIIVFHYPPDPGTDYIKRLIGLPGDHIQIQGGIVYVNSHPLTEPYIAEPPEYSYDQIVPEGSVFVLGDNRNDSSDSHSWGFVPIQNIVGKAIAVYWPLDALKTLGHPDMLAEPSP
jgi:signal peptidase I